jgi:hypothetical protein
LDWEEDDNEDEDDDKEVDDDNDDEEDDEYDKEEVAAARKVVRKKAAAKKAVKKTLGKQNRAVAAPETVRGKKKKPMGRAQGKKVKMESLTNALAMFVTIIELQHIHSHLNLCSSGHPKKNTLLITK